jgi:response regulator of citrate/malate metabolism
MPLGLTVRGVLDYIVKPLTLERLIRVANKAYELALPYKGLRRYPTRQAAQRHLFFKVDNHATVQNG